VNWTVEPRTDNEGETHVAQVGVFRLYIVEPHWRTGLWNWFVKTRNSSRHDGRCLVTGTANDFAVAKNQAIRATYSAAREVIDQIIGALL
jgi:hypothetical protein